MIDLATTLVTRVNRVLLVLASAIIVGLALFMTFVVIRRYVFSAPLGWALDVARAVFGYSVFLALAPTLQNRNHVSVDLVHARLPARIQHWATTAAWIMVMAFGALLLWQVGDHAWSAFETGRRFQGSWTVPAWYIYAVAPVGAFAFLLTAVVEFLRHVTGREHVPAWRAKTLEERT